MQRQGRRRQRPEEERIQAVPASSVQHHRPAGRIVRAVQIFTDVDDVDRRVAVSGRFYFLSAKQLSEASYKHQLQKNHQRAAETEALCKIFRAIATERIKTK